MLNTILKKRAQALAVILVLSILLTATAAFAAIELIRAKRGGTIDIAEGIWLEIQPRALEEDTVVSADMVRRRDQVYFYFGPDGTTFVDGKPAELCASWEAIDDADDLTLYGEGGEEIRPQIRKWGVVWYIDHFSLYYYRRR